MKYLIVLTLLLLLGTVGLSLAKSQVTPAATDDPGISNEDDADSDVIALPTATETPIVRPSSISQDEKIMDGKIDPYGDSRLTPLPTLEYVPMTHNFMTPLVTPVPSPMTRIASVTPFKMKKKLKPTPTPLALPSAALRSK